ncbi:MAG: HEAT repeat domain-containing protein [Gemmatimonadetes bacterium]|nr:HEAT repeat domain-containing protein [Gemmatimonadota bacterium]
MTVTALAAVPLQVPSRVDLVLRQPVLLLLAVGVGVLMVFAVALGVSVVLLRIRNTRTARRWARLEAKWQAVILDGLAEEAAPAAVWRLVGPDEELQFVDYLLRYARRLKGAEREIVRELAQPYLPRIAARVRHEDADRRARAVYTIGQLGLPRYVDLVTQALDDDAPLVAMIAALALLQRGLIDRVDAVLARLHRFVNWDPNLLASMLASVGQGVAAALRRALGDGTVPSTVRRIAATSLRYLNDVLAADVAAQLCHDESDPELVAACLRVLAAVGRPEHLSVVRRLMGSENFVVRAAAASALGTLGGPADLAVLRQAYEDDSRWVAIHAARALRQAGEIEVLQSLAASHRTRGSLAMQVLTETER